MRQAERAVAPLEAPRPVGEVEPGMRVRVADWEREATVIEAVGKDRALVAVVSFQVEVPLADLYPAEPHPLPPPLARTSRRGGSCWARSPRPAAPP